MYYKDFLLKLTSQGTKQKIQIPLEPILSKRDIFISYDIHWNDLYNKGHLINNLEIKIDLDKKINVEYCVIELKKQVFDVAKPNEKDLKFLSFENYPLPIQEFKTEDFVLHIVHNEEIPFECISLWADIIILNDPLILTKIPNEWSYSLEPSWNSMKIKFEKGVNGIQLNYGIGWISWNSWIDVCRKKVLNNGNGMDSEESESNSHVSNSSEKYKGYHMTSSELGDDFKMMNFLSLNPPTLQENMHTYFQWKSIRKNLESLIVN